MAVRFVVRWNTEDPPGVATRGFPLVGRMSEAALSIGLSLDGVYVDDAGTAVLAVGSGESPEGIRQFFTSSDFVAAREDLDIPEPDEMLVLELVGPSAAGAESEVGAAAGGADDA